MKKAKTTSAVAAVLVWALAPQAIAQLTEFTWDNPALVGAQNWQVDGNWDMTGWPDDPGRMEPDATIIVPSEGANVSVALTGNLSLNVGATNVTVASLKLGGTAGAVTTNITSTGGKLVFENYEANNTAPVDPDPDICSFNCGQALVTSAGVAGSTNIISAPVQINGERLVFGAASTNNLTISGPVTFANLAAPGSASSIRSLMPTGTKLTISGSISLVDTVTTMGVPLAIHDTIQVPPSPPTTTSVQSVPSTGTIEISGVIQDTLATAAPFGSLQIGTTSANQALGTLILSGTNTYRGQTLLNRANLVLANDSALGVDTTIGNDRSGGATFANGNPSNNFGFNFISDNDNRTITIDARFSQWQTVRGDNSLTWAGLVTQGNTRGWVNLLPTDTNKTLTVSGVTFAQSVSSTDTTIENRIFTYDGSGKTIVTGGWRDKIKGGVATFDGSLGHFRKSGTGVVFVSDPGGISDFTGDVIVDQGNIHFSDHLIFDQARYVTSTGGAIGVDTGTFTNATLLQRLDAMGPGLKLNHGGLMLNASESAAAINFTLGDLANLSNMSVAAPENGISYTGMITPAADTFTGVATYRLGGGSGTLTLPGIQPSNQLTGARNLQVTNGGEVRLNGANTYSGKTTIQAKYHSSVENQAIANTTTNITSNIYEGTTLAVNTLLNGGVNSSIGSSSSAASNLVIQGSTLKYVGTGSNGTTNRLFTVGTGGATLDASGAVGSVMNFTNTGSLAMAVPAPQNASIFDTGSTSDGVSSSLVNTRTRINIEQVDDLLIGMTVSGLPALGAGAVFSQINQPSPTFQNFQLTIPQVAAGTAESGTVTFSGLARTVTLTGLNIGNNTLAPLITDAAAASGTNTVNVVKSGIGKWILTGNNTYTGTTNVNAGTLLINGNQTGTGLTTVASGGTLGGTGSVGGGLTVNSGGHLAPGASIGTLTVGGAVTFAAGSILDYELGAPGNSDRLNVNLSGGLTINGGILNLTNLGGLAAGTYTLIDYAGALTGTVDSILFGTVPAGFGYDLIDTGSVINLSVVPAPTNDADFNNDGLVNAADYVVWRKFDGAMGTGTQQTGDANGDTNVNATDYGIWRNTFGSSIPGAGGSGIVPEPSSIVLVGLALLGVLGRSRRDR